jgi:hypothetical protein
MLARGIRIAREDERSKDLAVHGPTPGLCRGRDEAGDDERDQDGTAHFHHSSVLATDNSRCER